MRSLLPLALVGLFFAAAASQSTEAPTGFDNNTNGVTNDATHQADQKNVNAMILADMIKRDTDAQRKRGSTPWLVDLIWATAARLGYSNVFVNENYLVGGDDHFSFINRGISACDIIDFEDVENMYWHTPQDTLDKVDPRSLAIVGHVLLESVPELEKKSR
jgi:Zn-dependent M28 family amino/carboxypeptidase